MTAGTKTLHDALPQSVERHAQDFEEFEFLVSVDNNGDVWASFHESSKCAFSCSLDDLKTCVEFASRHGEHE